MVDDAEQQLEFLSEIQQSIGKSAVRNHYVYCYLEDFPPLHLYLKIKCSHAQFNAKP